MLMVASFFKADTAERTEILELIHGRPFRNSLDTAIRREARSPDQRIREQLIKIQLILYEELSLQVLRIPTVQEIEHILVNEVITKVTNL